MGASGQVLLLDGAADRHQRPERKRGVNVVCEAGREKEGGKVKILDLFCGTKSLQKPCEDLGHYYFGVDIERKFNPDMVADVMNLNASEIPFIPDVIWASPPCTHFSVASIGRNWNKDRTPKSEGAKVSLRLLDKTIALIKELRPTYYFIENPRGMMRKMSAMESLPIRHTVSYCQYGDKRMKPTDIWTNCGIWTPRPMCKNGDRCHVRSPRGSKTGTQGLGNAIDRAKVPYALLREILFACEREGGLVTDDTTKKFFDGLRDHESFVITSALEKRMDGLEDK